MIIVGILLLAIGTVFLVAGLTGRPKAVIGIEAKTGAPLDNVPLDTLESSPETSVETSADIPPEIPPEPPSAEVPTSRRLSTIFIGIVGVFFGVISIIGSTAD
jgi:hypothetical protein